ncbi:MAG: NAAT family transporter [Austwickia sp.]|nr:MarC family protein [Actinomycetota bacterium]MCB1252279.1 NAAT family transporter [Austwickia sp.]
MSLDAGFFGSVFVSLLVILDPPGALPVFLGLTKAYKKQQRQAVAARASVVAFGVLLTFALVGEQVLQYLKISVPALQISGGLLLLLIGLELLMGKEEAGAELARSNIALVPLAVPLFAGPGVIVTIMVSMQRADTLGQRASIILALAAAMAVVYLSMRYAGAIHRVLREGGTTLVSRIAGLLCAAIAVQMMANGVIGFVRTI